jgi:hypothetical protein
VWKIYLRVWLLRPIHLERERAAHEKKRLDFYIKLELKPGKGVKYRLPLTYCSIFQANAWVLAGYEAKARKIIKEESYEKAREPKKPKVSVYKGQWMLQSYRVVYTLCS